MKLLPRQHLMMWLLPRQHSVMWLLPRQYFPAQWIWRKKHHAHYRGGRDYLELWNWQRREETTCSTRTAAAELELTGGEATEQWVLHQLPCYCPNNNIVLCNQHCWAHNDLSFGLVWFYARAEQSHLRTCQRLKPTDLNILSKTISQHSAPIENHKSLGPWMAFRPKR